MQLERLDVRVALGRRWHGVFGEERSHQAVPEVGESEALHVGVALVLAGSGDPLEVDEGVVGVPAVDGEGGDPRRR